MAAALNPPYPRSAELVPVRVELNAAQAVQVSAEVPELLVSLLERRYLSQFRPGMWRIGTAAEDGARPILRQIVTIGRERPGADWASVIPSMLTATHELGQAAVMTLHGDGERHHIHLGGRRIGRRAQGSTEDFLDGQSSLLQAYLPGLRLAEPARLDGEELSGLSEFLRCAPSMAVVTGVPSPRPGTASVDGSALRNIDRLVQAAGARRYALMVLAEPLTAPELDTTIDRCRTLKSEIHALVRRTVSRSRTEGESDARTNPEQSSGKSDMALPGALYGLAMFCSLAGVATGMGPLIQMATPAMLAGGIARTTNQVKKGSTTTSTTSSRAETATAEFLDATAEACEVLLQRHIDRLEAARGSGWWRTSVFVAAENDATLSAVTGALRGMASGAGSGLDPVRVVRPPAHLIRTAITRGVPLRLSPMGGQIGHPLGELYDALATCMTSDELSVLMAPPRGEIPGLPRREVAEFSLSAPPPDGRSIHLGTLRDAADRTLGPIALSAESLNRHVFITGMTGYGKTTTAQRLLLESHTTLGLPFLVIEPVKAEYRRLATHPQLAGRLRVFTIGDRYGTPLRLNPFTPVEDVPLLRHIDLLKAVFNASFPMFAGMSYVLEEAMLDIYTDRGWNLETSTNEFLEPRAGQAERTALVPAMADLYDKVEQVLQNRQYGREVHQNLGAALRSRLRSLMVGTKGMALNTRACVSARELFDQPCVIELRNLGDDEEKAFVMALLLCQLYEYAEARQDGTGTATLRHLTLIEEAHRLLRAARGPSSGESADAQAKAVAIFTDLLAEMRSYGEGFIVADQIPTKLAPEILKNSSIKILHRLSAPDDRALVAAATNLDDTQSRYLGTLPPGVAVVHDNAIGSATLVQLTPLPALTASRPAPPSIGAPQVDNPSYLHRTAACRHCPAPCTLRGQASRIASEAETDQMLASVFQAVLSGDAQPAWRLWQQFRADWSRRATPGPAATIDTTNPIDATAGELYCASSQAAYRWLDRVRGHDGPLAPRLLVLTRCARSMATLCSSWAQTKELTDQERTVFSEVHSQLTDQLTARPPVERPGCARCPARCRMLPLVAPLVEDVRQSVAARSTTKTSVPARIRAVEAVTEVGRQLEALSEQRQRDALLYCLITNTTQDAHSTNDLLDALRDGRPQPDR